MDVNQIKLEMSPLIVVNLARLGDNPCLLLLLSSTVIVLHGMCTRAA